MLYTPITIEQWIEERKELLASFVNDLTAGAMNGEDNHLYLQGRRDMLKETLADLAIILTGPVEIP
jgi:hypothetical protein